ncbi:MULTISPECIES: glutaredoxin family protein [Bacillus cereus group]|uniref:glutaredoxin family protein n=1 Tax=Bacillus cereus group TaxID=86661 RepID=UPI00123AD94F|nr:glutaredoxin family protein [Bacillus cereus]KAA6457050.1 glutaredoxin family protein [Bacillus cereus]KAB2418886.1 glutaredoxin family protein [Bacillus cereus]KAB2439214.1 glutaredoxin family protein [Bacillus cereus]KAB2470260.1 glutaredoxin family protein [Bacillus cereus]
MATKIVMYTGNDCGKCKRAKEMLKNCPVEVDIEELNVDETPMHRKVLTKVYESNTLPTFIIGENVYRGFDENVGKIMEHLGL